MEALTRSTMSPPKALNSKTTSDRVETRRRKKNTQWHVCPSLQHTHARTGPTASGCSPQKENTHSRRCLGNALRQKKRIRTDTNETYRRRGNRNSHYETMWMELNTLHWLRPTKMWHEVRRTTVRVWQRGPVARSEPAAGSWWESKAINTQAWSSVFHFHTLHFCRPEGGTCSASRPLR